MRNDPAAQIAAIKEAFNGIVPTQPMQRRYPAAAWKDGNVYQIAKLISGKLSVRQSMEKLPTATLFRSVNVVSSYLSRTYLRRISLPDLRAASEGPIAVPTLEEAQLAVVCWVKDITKTKYSTPPEFQYCQITPDGIKGGTYPGKPKLREGSHAPVIEVRDFNSCITLLRHAFKLDVTANDIVDSMNKWVKLSKITVLSKKQINS